MGLQPINHTEHDVPGAAGVSRPGSTSHVEASLDLAQYLRPLEQAHAGALHGRGVAAGLAVTAAAGTTTLRVAPGVAVDAQGRHIVLAPGGSVETADDPGLSSRLIPITETGVDLSTVGRSGPGLVVVQWRETFDTTLLGGGNDRFVTRHTPWLQLTGTTLDPERDVVVLATVVLDAGGLVTAGGVTPDRRDTLALGSGGLTLRAATASGSAVAETDAATLRPRPGGGLDVQVSPGAPAPLSVTADGRVGIGTSTPGELLDVGGSAAVAGSLTVDGPLRVTDRITTTRAVGVGVREPGFLLDVAERIRLRQGETSSAGLWLFQQTPQGDRAFVGMANDDQVGLWGNTGIGWGLLMHTATGRVDVAQDLAVGGALSVRKSGGQNAVVGGQAFANESDFAADNLKVVMGSGRFPVLNGPFGPLGPSVDPFQFMVGYRRLGVPFTLGSRFVRVFSIDQAGNAFFAGGKGGYVVDYFVNAVGDDLEQGDVVVLRPGTPAASYGSYGAIPIPEVDLTDQPYDTRVCGIVADVVGPGSLPTVDEEPPAGAEEPVAEEPGPGERGTDQPGTGEPVPHPLARYEAEADQPRTTVRDQQMGRMVTLGAWAHCKVDADVAPIEAGDLLTTSATRGHAQKVTEPGRTPGAVVGKAMAPLASGRGTIPVLVTLH